MDWRCSYDMGIWQLYERKLICNRMQNSVENKIKEINFISSFLTVICYILFVFSHRLNYDFLKIILVIISLVNIIFILMGAIKTFRNRNLSIYKKSLISITIRGFLIIAMLLLIFM